MEQTKMIISQFVKKRYEFVRSLIVRLKHYNSNIPDNNINELINWMREDLGYLNSDNDIELDFRNTMMRFYYDAKITTFTNFNEFILTAEKCKIIEHVCQIIETLILKKGNNDKVEIFKCIFKDNFLDEFCNLKNQLTNEAKDLQEIINYPNINKYTLSMIHGGLLGGRRIYVDYTNLHVDLKNDYQKAEEFINLVDIVKNKILEIELAELNPEQNKKYIKALNPKTYSPFSRKFYSTKRINRRNFNF